MKAITNGHIILKDRILEGKVLVFEEKIMDICDNGHIPSGAGIIDAGGGYVSPGLLDLHIHGYLGEDVSDGKPQGIQKMAEGIVRNGVTGWLPTTMTVSKTEIEKAFVTARSLREESKHWNGAVILGVNAEGPFINPEKKGAQAQEHILKPNAELILAYRDIIKLVTIAPEMDEGLNAIKTIKKHTNIVISMGHTGADYAGACAAIDCGVSHATHMFNAMTPLNHRDPGVVGAALNRDVTVELIADTFHIHPELFGFLYKIKGRRLILITDCVRAGGLTDGDYTLGGQKIHVKGIECRLEDGTIAGSVLTLNQAVRNMHLHTNIPLYDIIACASLYPAQIIHADDRKGSLEIGKDADIVIFGDDFQVKKTIIGGAIKYEA